MHRWIIAIGAIGLSWPRVAGAAPVDCSEAYGGGGGGGGKATQCERVTCDPKVQSFVGVWKGPFEAYVKDLSKNGNAVFRPYENTTSYAAVDCLKNPASGETFIIGHMTDVYPVFASLPAKTSHSLLITGKSADGSPFLRTVDEKQQVASYHLEYRNGPASLAIWTLSVPGHDHSPEMEIVTIDGRDLTAQGIDRRNVTITLRVGPKETPFFEGVIGKGFHTRQP